MRSLLLATVTAVVLLGACSNGTGGSGNTAGSAASQQQAQLDRAIAAIKARNYGEAEGILNGILAGNPNDPYANLAMGALKAIVDEKDVARQHYQVAIRNGAQAPVSQTVTANGATKTVSTTVAEVARGNVSRL